MLTLTFDQRLPTQLPTTLPVYAVAPLPSPTRDIEAIARSWPDLTLAQAKVRRLDNWIAADYGQLRLIYQQVSGAVQATVRATRVWEGNVRFPIEDDRVIEIARAFIGKLNLVSDEVSKLAVGKVTHLQRQCASSEGVQPPEILDAGVVFTRVIDETPVVGPGGCVMVKVLPDGAIAGASRVFRQRGAKVATVRVTPSADAIAKFEERLRRYRHLDGTVRVLRAQFGYFEASRNLRQRFFEPAYVFVYTTDGRFPFKFDEVIQASGSNRGRPGATNF